MRRMMDALGSLCTVLPPGLPPAHLRLALLPVPRPLTQARPRIAAIAGSRAGGSAGTASARDRQ